MQRAEAQREDDHNARLAQKRAIMDHLGTQLELPTPPYTHTHTQPFSHTHTQQARPDDVSRTLSVWGDLDFPHSAIF